MASQITFIMAYEVHYQEPVVLLIKQLLILHLNYASITAYSS